MRTRTSSGRMSSSCTSRRVNGAPGVSTTAAVVVVGMADVLSSGRRGERRGSGRAGGPSAGATGPRRRGGAGSGDAERERVEPPGDAVDRAGRLAGQLDAGDPSGQGREER